VILSKLLVVSLMLQLECFNTNTRATPHQFYETQLEGGAMGGERALKAEEIRLLPCIIVLFS